MSTLAKDWKQLTRGRPGRRFVDFHQVRCKRRAGGWPRERVVTLTLGIGLVVVGLAIGWLPGPGGFLAVIGLALLGIEWLRVAKLLDRVELSAWELWRSLRRLVGRGTPSR